MFLTYVWRRKWQPTPVFLPGESHGWRSLVGYSPQGRKESDTTERLHSLLRLIRWMTLGYLLEFLTFSFLIHNRGISIYLIYYLSILYLSLSVFLSSVCLGLVLYFTTANTLDSPTELLKNSCFLGSNPKDRFNRAVLELPGGFYVQWGVFRRAEILLWNLSKPQRAHMLRTCKSQTSTAHTNAKWVSWPTATLCMLSFTCSD